MSLDVWRGFDLPGEKNPVTTVPGSDLSAFDLDHWRIAAFAGGKDRGAVNAVTNRFSTFSFSEFDRVGHLLPDIVKI